MELLAQVLLVHHHGRPDLFKEKGAKYTLDELKDLIADEENPIFVCTDDEGKVLCHCFCRNVEAPERPSTYAYKSLYIDDLCVDEVATDFDADKASDFDFVDAHGLPPVIL